MESEIRKNSSAGNFLKQGSILAAASIIVRMIGLVYRIPMANIIGNEGNGIYSVAFEIYNILLIVSSYAMPMAVSKMVSAKCVRGKYKEAYHLFYSSMIFSACTGGAAALFVFFGADWIERSFFKSFRGIAIPLRVLAPTIFVVAIMGTIRGLFQGRKNMVPTAFSQIVEQIVNAFVSVTAAYLLMCAHSASPKLSAWGAAGGTMGTCLGAVSALLILLLIFLLYQPIMRKQKRRDRRSRRMSRRTTYKIILCTTIPIILSQTVYQLSGIVDVTLINTLLGKRGISDQQISTWQGIYSTNYRLLASVPIAISTAIASSLIPSLVASFVQEDWDGVDHKITQAVKFNMIIAIPSAVGLAVLGVPIIRVLFPSTDYKMGGMMMLIGSSCIVFYALSTVTSGVLQSVDQMRKPAIHSLISLAIHIALVICLMLFTDLGVYALVIGNVTYPLVVCILNGISVRNRLDFHQEYLRTFCIPLLSSAVMGALSFVTFEAFHFVTRSNLIALIPAMLVAMLSYFIVTLKLGAVSRSELKDFPMGRTLTVYADKMHLLK